MIFITDFLVKAEQKTPLLFCHYKYISDICRAKQNNPDWLSMCIV